MNVGIICPCLCLCKQIKCMTQDSPFGVTGVIGAMPSQSLLPIEIFYPTNARRKSIPPKQYFDPSTFTCWLNIFIKWVGKVALVDEGLKRMEKNGAACARAVEDMHMTVKTKKMRCAICSMYELWHNFKNISLCFLFRLFLIIVSYFQIYFVCTLNIASATHVFLDQARNLQTLTSQK